MQKVSDDIVASQFQQFDNQTNRWKKQYVEQIPIPKDMSNKAKIERLVMKMMENPNDSKTAAQIDLEVCKAFGLDEEQTRTVLGKE